MKFSVDHRTKIQNKILKEILLKSIKYDPKIFSKKFLEDFSKGISRKLYNEMHGAISEEILRKVHQKKEKQEKIWKNLLKSFEIKFRRNRWTYFLSNTCRWLNEFLMKIEELKKSVDKTSK